MLMKSSEKRVGAFLGTWLVLLAATTARAQQPVTTVGGFRPAGVSALNARLRVAVDRKEIAGAVALLMRDGKVGVLEAVGQRDEGVPMTTDTIFRIASMTKPITSVAALMLIDEGRLSLDDPVSMFIPEFKDARVVVPGSAEKGKLETKPAAGAMTVRHLLTHTSGLTYRFFGGEVGNLYAKAGVSDGLSQSEGSNEDNARKIAAQPLLFSPGSSWNYSLSTDVLGRIVEVASGQSLDAFFRERIFTPLKMVDTRFFLPSEKVGRLAKLYEVGGDRVLRRVGEEPRTVGTLVYSSSYQYKGPRSLFSGGAGLTSTASDYGRFLQMLLNGGTLDGVRILRPQTVRAMTSNQIGDLPLTLGQNHGDRFGFGVGVVTPAGKDKVAMSPGSFSWGGFFHTYAWVDPEKKLVGVFMTQLYPSGGTPIQADFVKTAYGALAD
jgi:CubicO group peptidase (beta-lactamase class C family)